MQLNIVTYLAIMILAGMACGRLVKLLKLPNVTGYLIAGLLIGPSLLGLIPENVVTNTGIISDVALAFIAFSIGNEFKLSYFKRVGKAPIVIAFLEALFGVLFVFATLLFTNHGFKFALLLASIAAATDPAATIMVIRQYKAKGPVSEMLMSVAAIDDAAALIFFGICVAIVQSISASGDTSVSISILKPIAQILGALIIGVIFGFILTWLFKWFKKDGNQISIVVAFVFASVGISELLNLSSLLLCMAMGTILVNCSDQSDKVMKLTDCITPPILILFFVDSGASLKLSALAGIGIIGVIYVVFRVIGKAFGVIAGAKICHCDKVISRYLGYALVPQAGVAIGLSLMTAKMLPEYGDLIRTVILCSTLIYELVGPVLSKYALTKSGDIKAGTP